MALLTIEDVDSFLQRVEVALVELEAALRDLGYRFENPNGPVQFHESQVALDKLDSIRANYGHLPVLFERLYTRFREVDFSQHPAQLLEPNSDPVAGLGLNCSLIFLRLEDSAARLKDIASQPNSGTYFREQSHFIPTGGIASNCTYKGIWVPDASMDPVLFDDGGGPITLSCELANAIRAGGFPFWKHLFTKRRFSSPIRNTPHASVIERLSRTALLL